MSKPTSYPFQFLRRYRDTIRAEARQQVIDTIRANPDAYLVIDPNQHISGATFAGPLIILSDGNLVTLCSFNPAATAKGFFESGDFR